MSINVFNNEETNNNTDRVLSCQKGKHKVIVIACIIIVFALMMFATNLCRHPVGVIIRVVFALCLMADIRWIRWFFIVTGFLSALTNIILAFGIYSLIGTDGNGMLFPIPTGTLNSFDFLYCLLLGIFNCVLAILLLSNKDIKAYYQNLTCLALNKKINKMTPDERAMIMSANPENDKDCYIENEITENNSKDTL